MSLDSAGRKNKIRFISDTMTGFYSIMRNLQEDYRTYSGNFSEETLALLSRSYGFTESADAIRTLGSLDRIDDEGVDELFGLSQTISELYHLGVQPEIQNTETDISKLSYIDKIEKALKYSNAIDEIKEEIGDIRLLALQMASVAGVMIALAATGYGAAAEALGFVLLAVGAAFSGTQLLAGIIGLVKFLTTVDDANTEEDLKKCGKIFGEAIAKIGVDGLFFALSMFGLKKASVKFTTKTVVDNGMNSKKWVGRKIEERGISIDGKPIVNESFKGHKYNSIPDSSPYAKNAVEIIENHNHFIWVEGKKRWLSPNGTRKIWFENIWKYQDGNGRIVEEFTILKEYGMKKYYKTSTVSKKSFMQAHHGIKSEWAMTNKYLRFYYNKNKAPCLLLRDSCKGTPHQAITSAQAKRDINVSYAIERINLKNDCKMLEIPDSIINQFLAENDAYFGEIYKQMLSDKKIPKPIVDSIFRFDFETRMNK